MNELLVSKACAEKVLREQSGNVVAALEAIISNWDCPDKDTHCPHPSPALFVHL